MATSSSIGFAASIGAVAWSRTAGPDLPRVRR
jgi:hypothetical protein